MTRIERTLPEEVWIQVFSFLTTEEKHSVRRSCRYFRELVDKYASLWKDFSVVLSKFSAYNRPFWSTLSRRSTSRVVLRGGKRKNLKHLAISLPSLTTLVMENWTEENVEDLKAFPNLKRLAINNSPFPVDISRALVPLSTQVTHLNVCNVKLRGPVVDFLSTVSKMSNVSSLVFHHDGSQRVPVKALHAVLSGLPRLSHLSWEMISYKTLPEDFFKPLCVQRGSAGDGQSGVLPLSSLELLNYDTVVSEEALSSLSGLRSLSVYHLYSVPGPRCHLKTWLTALQKLTTLTVHGGHPLGAYADCMPATVTSLTVCVDMKEEDLVTLGARVPNLQHLHLEPWVSGGHVGLVPQLFPRLRTLNIRHHKVPDRDFLGLHQLQHLVRLEILDPYYWPDRAVPEQISYQPSPHLLTLVRQLQSLSGQRIHVVTSRCRRDPLTCNCV